MEQAGTPELNREQTARVRHVYLLGLTAWVGDGDSWLATAAGERINFKIAGSTLAVALFLKTWILS